MAKKVVDGDLDIERLRLLPDDEVCKELVKLDGVGVWTAEMLLIFFNAASKYIELR